jgi:hypothetical protein
MDGRDLTVGEAEELRRRLLARPGRPLIRVAKEMGIGIGAVRKSAVGMGLGNYRDRLIASGRSLSGRRPLDARGEAEVLVSLWPGQMLHFDSAQFGRFLYEDGRAEPVYAYSMVDRCSGWCWSWVCTGNSPQNAVAALRSFALSAPFSLSGGRIIVDARGDVTSDVFGDACRALGLRRTGLVGGNPRSNAMVEKFHYLLRFAGLASCSMEELNTWGAICRAATDFCGEMNRDRSTIFPGSALASPMEIVNGMVARKQLPPVARALECRVVFPAELQRSIPMGFAPDGDCFGRHWVPLAEVWSESWLNSQVVAALLTTRRPRVRHLGIRKIHRELKGGAGPGLYIFC